jgi:ribonuclease G
LKKIETRIYVNVTDYETRIGVVENNQLVELLTERPEAERIVGDIYKGKVTAVLPGIQAAFVDIGLEKAGFLHLSDTTDYHGSKSLLFDMDFMDDESLEKPTISERKKSTSITNVLKKGQEILVQVIREPIDAKGPRLTSIISLPGRYMVMIPGGKQIGISKKIFEHAEKKRLRKTVTSMKPPNFGIIVRTVARGKDGRSFRADMNMLTKRWEKMKKQIEKSQAPALVHKDLELTAGIIRDLLTPDVVEVMIDNKKEYSKIIKYLKALDPKLRSIVKFYKGKEPLFDKVGIEPEIEKMLERKVWIKRGSNIVIDQTEALVTIDVNTGRFTGRGKWEDALFKTNMEAAREIARQIRLRDIGGIIIVDFIDMESRDHRHNVYNEFKNALSRDRSENYISSISDLGLVEMTRKRIRPSFMHAISDRCPVCDGVGRVLSRESMAVKIERWFKRAASAEKTDHFQLIANPQVADLLFAGKPSRLRNLEKNLKRKIDIIIDTTLHPEEFNVLKAGSAKDITDKYMI